MIKKPSFFHHLRDVLILPVTITILVPYYLRPHFVTGYALFKISGIALGLAGSSLFLYTVFLFGTLGKGTLAPWSPKQKLVVAGPYRYCRNPMITGVLCILSAEALFFHSADLLIWMGSFFVFNTLHFVIWEEPDLEEKFGNDYRVYKKHVPRWIPRIKPFDPDLQQD